MIISVTTRLDDIAYELYVDRHISNIYDPLSSSSFRYSYYNKINFFISYEEVKEFYDKATILLRKEKLIEIENAKS